MDGELSEPYVTVWNAGRMIWGECRHLWSLSEDDDVVAVIACTMLTEAWFYCSVKIFMFNSNVTSNR